MQTETQTKFAAILAAAQAKTAVKTTVNFAPIPETVKEAEIIAPVTKPTVADIFPEIVQDSTPELSTLTPDALLNEIAGTPQPTENTFNIVDYSDKAFAIVTAVKPPESILNIFRLHGTYNANLRCGKGWIFSKRHLAAIKEKLAL